MKDYLNGRLNAKTKKKHTARRKEQAIPIHIRVFGIDLDRNSRTSLRQKLNRKLSKFAAPIERVSLRLHDINGPKGGVDHACHLKVVLRKLPTVIVKEQDVSVDAAVSEALEAAHRAVRRSLQRRH